MSTIKYKVSKNQDNGLFELEIYRPYGERKFEWMMIDRLNEMTATELKSLADYINSLFVKKNANTN